MVGEERREREIKESWEVEKEKGEHQFILEDESLVGPTKVA